MKKLLACLLVVSMSGCPEVKVDADEVGTGPIVEFDPGRTQSVGARFIPFPNDAARDPVTGKVNLPPQACETPSSKFTREEILNKLDGFGTYETALQVTFTQPVDPASLTDRIVMYKIASSGVPIMPSATSPTIPLRVIRVGTTPRFSTGDCNAPELVNAVTFVSPAPLEQKTTYFVALKKGIKDTNGVDFAPAFTWALVASDENPVTVNAEGIIVSDRTPIDPSSEEGRASLLALNGLWKLHAPGIAFVEATGTPRADLLVAFQFTTQTTTDPLDPTVANSPASSLSSVGILQASSISGRFGQASAYCAGEEVSAPTQCFLKLALGGCSPLTTGCGTNNYTDGSQACLLASCAAIGNVIGGGVATANYQRQLPNPLPGGTAIQGAWNDPVHPTQEGTLALETIIVVPASARPPNGWPTILFSHGIGSSKETVFAIAGRFAQAGFATVSIDTAAHGSRAVRVSKDQAKACIGRCFSGTTATATECDNVFQCEAGQTCGNVDEGLLPPAPTIAPQCYAPFLSPDLAMTRDGIRQTVLDHLRVINAIKTCTTTEACAGAVLDPEKIYFAGFSLGGFIGTVTAAVSPDIKTTLINAGGVGWADFLENTQTLAIRCSLIDGLIDAGILSGKKWDNGTNADALCTTDAWKTQPGFTTFASIGRWVLDPADGANYTTKLAPKRLLIQEIVGDTVVPNVTTDNLAALVGLASSAKAGDPIINPLAPAPSAAIQTMPKTNKFMKYTSDADIVFAHPSFLRPAPTEPAQGGINGTLRLQVDAATFMNANQ